MTLKIIERIKESAEKRAKEKRQDELNECLRSLIRYFSLSAPETIARIDLALDDLLLDQRAKKYPSHVLVALAYVKAAIDTVFPSADGGITEEIKKQSSREASEWLAYYGIWPKAFWTGQKHLIDAAAGELAKATTEMLEPQTVPA
jgi:hypothetical protein